MKTAILAGGLGSRLAEETEARPKPMVEIGGMPILWHIMRYYAHFGFKDFAVALGCDIRHAGRLVYAKGLDLGDPEAAVPIGPGCKVCDRNRCAQRAFPAIGRQLEIDENVRQFAPYAGGLGL